MLNYVQYGQGYPLIILHGLLGSSENWKTVAQKLGQYFDVYAVDLRNHGMSFHCDEMSYRDMAADVIELMAYYHLDRPIIMGHSMGGKVAMAITDCYEAPIHQLIIVDIINKKYDNRHLDLLVAMENITLGDFNSLQTLSSALEKEISNPQLRGFILKNTIRNANVFKWKVNVTAIKSNYVNISKKVPLKSMITVPTIIIRGGNSYYVTDYDVSTVMDTFECVEIETIADTGHWVHVESPIQFLNAVCGFIVD